MKALSEKCPCAMLIITLIIYLIFGWGTPIAGLIFTVRAIKNGYSTSSEDIFVIPTICILAVFAVSIAYSLIGIIETIIDCACGGRSASKCRYIFDLILMILCGLFSLAIWIYAQVIFFKRENKENMLIVTKAAYLILIIWGYVGLGLVIFMVIFTIVVICCRK